MKKFRGWKTVSTVLAVAVLAVSLQGTVYAKGECVTDVLQDYGIDSGDISCYELQGEVIEVDENGIIQNFETSFTLKAKDHVFRSKPVVIKNTGSIDLEIYAGSFKYVSLKTPRVVDPDRFDDWAALSEAETARNIAIGLNYYYLDKENKSEPDRVQESTGEDADFWFKEENSQTRELLARLAPNESAVLSLAGRFGLKWQQDAELKYIFLF